MSDPDKKIDDGDTSFPEKKVKGSPTRSADESKDSALQYVCMDLVDNGFEPGEQEALLKPIEEEIEQHIDSILRDGLRKAFQTHAHAGAEHVINQLIEQITFDEVPEEHREDIKEVVTTRLKEKKRRIALELDDTKNQALRSAEIGPQEQITEWGTLL